jgi:ubiquinone/menaquinone biosynthesis C-methylase UbiE
VAQLAFDEATGRQLEALYEIGDAVRRRCLVRGALGATPGARVLDIGCGPGFYCAELREEVGPEGAIVGLDSSPQMLALAARRCSTYDNVEFRQAEATSLAVDDASFDGLLCVQVLEYVPQTSAALAEFYRVLRPGGRAVVWDIDWATVSWHSSHPDRMAQVLQVWDEHLVHPSLPRTLARAMRAAGFEQVQMQAHAFATIDFDADMFAVAMIPMIAGFAAGRGGVSDDDADKWAAEQRELGSRGEFYFAGTQFCFSAVRPAEGARRASAA